MNVPFLDLKTQYKELEHEVVPMVMEAMANGAFIGGPQVQGFEEEFAAFCDSQYCVGVNSGTDALRFALLATGIGPGDEVVTVPNTFIATTEAISQVDAAPVFVDIDEKTYNMDPQKLEDLLKARSAAQGASRKPAPRAIIPVHLYGQPADMDAILDIAQRYDLTVIEDACQAHGARYKGRKAGSMGSVGCFSFYPGKNLGAYGEGGAVVTEDEDIANKIRMIRDHGQAKKYVHTLEGYNGRLDAIQAGVLRIKLKRLQDWNERRRKNAGLYAELLANVHGVTLPFEAGFADPVYHLYVILVEDREGLQGFLAEKGIAAGLHYPIPLHLQEAYAHLGYKEGDFPITENAAKRLLSLPMFPELTREQITYVADAVKQFIQK